jgi:uncharacterized protein
MHHDGKLFRSRRDFAHRAPYINHYLEEWNAAGFRSGFMMRRLGWLHELDIAYDMSSFDTDPFEPEPDGVNTIFPFWVPRHSTAESISYQSSTISQPRNGYAELPYTLPQDSTLFLLMRQTSNGIWRKKLDWIAKHGGMVLLNTHPDYIRFDGSHDSLEFLSTQYEDFLKYIRSRYAGQHWHVLPRQMAEFVSQHRDSLKLPPAVQYRECTVSNRAKRKIWIDLDNTPHVPFFRPIIKNLEERGYGVVVTARDAFQVCELATDSRLNYTKIGRHYGKTRLFKVLGLVWRAFQLLPFVLGEEPLVGLSHGSRSQLLLCNLLRIPTIMLNDYEHAKTPPLLRPRWEIVPDVLFGENLHCKSRERIRTYRGIKEDVYAPEFRPDPSIIERLHLNGDVIVVVRPPATEAHYHNPESERIFVHFMNRLCGTQDAKAILLPRNKRQETELRERWPQWFDNCRVVVPERAVDGLNLLWHSDLVVSGGGTMNREAAALDVPVYSIFQGKIGAVDRSLQREGRLTLIESIEEVQTRIPFQRRDRSRPLGIQPRYALQDIVEHVEDILQAERAG